MDLVILVIIIAAIGFLVWLVTNRIPMPPLWATTLQVVALILVVLYLLRYFAVLPNILPRQ